MAGWFAVVIAGAFAPLASDVAQREVRVTVTIGQVDGVTPCIEPSYEDSKMKKERRTTKYGFGCMVCLGSHNRTIKM